MTKFISINQPDIQALIGTWRQMLIQTGRGDRYRDMTIAYNPKTRLYGWYVGKNRSTGRKENYSMWATVRIHRTEGEGPMTDAQIFASIRNQLRGL